MANSIDQQVGMPLIRWRFRFLGLLTRMVFSLLICLCAAGVRSAEEKDKTERPEPAAEFQNLSPELKALLDGVLAIYRSDTMMIDQQAIMRTLGVKLIFQKYPRGDRGFHVIEGLPPEMSGKYEISQWLTAKPAVTIKLQIYSLDANGECIRAADFISYTGLTYTKTYQTIHARPISYSMHSVPDRRQALIRRLSFDVTTAECVRHIWLGSVIENSEWEK